MSAAARRKRKTDGSEEDAVPIQGAALPEGVPSRWEYSLSLFKDLSILRLVLKVFFLICIGMGAFLALLQVIDGPGGWRGVPDAVMPMGVVFGIFAAISIPGYLLYALVMGGSYRMVFTMDGTMVRHAQHPKQFERYRKMAFLLMFLSLFRKGGSGASGMGIGMTTANRQSMTTVFSKVKRIEADPAREVIHLTEGHSHNRIYVRSGQYESVLGHIRACCPKASFYRKDSR